MNNQNGAIEFDGQPFEFPYNQRHGSIVVNVASAAQSEERVYYDEVGAKRTNKLFQALKSRLVENERIFVRCPQERQCLHPRVISSSYIKPIKLLLGDAVLQAERPNTPLHFYAAVLGIDVQRVEIIRSPNCLF